MLSSSSLNTSQSTVNWLIVRNARNFEERFKQNPQGITRDLIQGFATELFNDQWRQTYKINAQFVNVLICRVISNLSNTREGVSEVAEHFFCELNKHSIQEKNTPLPYPIQSERKNNYPILVGKELKKALKQGNDPVALGMITYHTITNTRFLKEAIRFGCLQSIQKMLEIQPPENKQDFLDQGLHDSIQFYKEDSMLFFLENGANPNSIYQETAPIHLFCSHKETILLEKFIDNSPGIDLNLPDSENRSPLFLAYLHTNVPLFTLLLGKGADVHSKDPQGVPIKESMQNCPGGIAEEVEQMISLL